MTTATLGLERLGLGRSGGGFALGAGHSPGREAISLDEIRRRAETAVRNLPPMNMPAEQYSQAVARGIHGRRKAGPGDAFWQFRPYHQGDPASLIDWRRSARSDLSYVRQNEWETAQNVWLWCDLSGSMLFRSSGATETKIERAMTLAVAAAMLLVAGGEKVGYAGAMNKAANGAYAITGIIAALDLARFSGSPPLPDPDALGRQSHLIAIGDFLTGPETILRQIRALSARGISGHLIHIVDPAEEEFPFQGRVKFLGLEGEADEIVPRAENIRVGYVRRMRDWQKALADIAITSGWSYMLHHTNRPAHLALIGLHGAVEAATNRTKLS